MKDTVRIWLVSAAYWLVGSVLICLLSPLTAPDSMARYAPMADAFARGDWFFAFHPRFGVLFQCVSGSIAFLTGLSGDRACQVASLLFLSLAAIPLWHLAKALFDERIAWWAVVALFVCDDFTRYAFDGLRDVGKCLAFALLGLGAVKQKGLWFGLGLFVLVTLVSYGFAVASVLLVLWYAGRLLVRPCSRPPTLSFLLSTLNSLIPLIFYLLATTMVAFMVHAYTGHWLPAPHFIKLFGRWL